MSQLFSLSVSGDGHDQWEAVATEIDEPALEVQDQQIDDTWEAPEEIDGFNLRPYQSQAVKRVEEELYGKPARGEDPGISPSQSTLLVMATGLGKTVCISEAVRRRKPGKVLVLAHRSELIYQAKATLEALCGEPATIEMADNYASPHVDIVVATIQTLISGMNGDGRMIAFDPNDFSLMVTDEAHHGCAASYRRIYNYFHQNLNLKHLGVTATPDRADEEALGKVFQSVAYTYEIADAIKDGWLVPIRAVPIHIEGLDYSSIQTTAGDLNGADLAKVMEDEGPLHEMVQAVIEVVCQIPPQSLMDSLHAGDDTGFHRIVSQLVRSHRPRKTLIFAASVKHAERLCEILNRWLPDSACWVHGGTPKDVRKQTFADYKAGRYVFLVNVGVCTEGWDEPTVEVVVMARPTKSRALYSQMLGRGTRALPGVVDGPETPEARKAAIAASGKPCVTCIDFVGVCGRHTLITPADILGGNYEDAVVEKAKKIVEASDRQATDMEEALEEARQQIEAEKAREAAKRAKIRVGSKYTIGQEINPFTLFNVTPYREKGWERGKPVSEKMRACLERAGLWNDEVTYSTARQLIQGMSERREKHLCTFKQAKALAKRGLPTNVSFETAHRWMDQIAGNNWRVPASVQQEAAEYASR